MKKLPVRDAKHINTVILSLTTDPFYGDVQKMKGQNYAWRRRVGSYRILYDIYAETKQIHVYGIKHRTSTTY